MQYFKRPQPGRTYRTPEQQAEQARYERECAEAAARQRTEAERSLIDMAAGEMCGGLPRWTVLPTGECRGTGTAGDMPYQLAVFTPASGYIGVWGLDRDMPLREALADFDHLADVYTEPTEAEISEWQEQYERKHGAE
jgi:hypothetical protein